MFAGLVKVDTPTNEHKEQQRRQRHVQKVVCLSQRNRFESLNDFRQSGIPIRFNLIRNQEV